MQKVGASSFGAREPASTARLLVLACTALKAGALKGAPKALVVVLKAKALWASTKATSILARHSHAGLWPLHKC